MQLGSPEAIKPQRTLVEMIGPLIFSFNIQGIGDRSVHCSWKPFGCPVSKLPERLEHRGDRLEGLVGLRLLLH